MNISRRPPHYEGTAMILKLLPYLIGIGAVFGLLFAAIYIAFSAVTGLSANSSAVIGGIGAACGVVSAMWLNRRHHLIRKR